MSNLAIQTTPAVDMLKSMYTFRYSHEKMAMMGLDRPNDTGLEFNELYDILVDIPVKWEFIGVGMFTTPKGVDYQSWIQLNINKPMKGKDVVTHASTDIIHTLIREEPVKHMYDFLVVAKPLGLVDSVTMNDVLHNISSLDGSFSPEMLIGYYGRKWK